MSLKAFPQPRAAAKRLKEPAVMEKGAKRYYTESETRIAVVLWEHLLAGDLSELTVTQVCREAGVSRDTFYRHFSSPEQALAVTTARYHLDFIRRNTRDAGDYAAFLASSIREMGRDNVLPKYVKPLLTSGDIHLEEQLIATTEEELLQLGYFAPLMNSADCDEQEKRFLTHAYCAEFLSVIKYWTLHPEMTGASVYRLLLLLYSRLIRP